MLDKLPEECIVRVLSKTSPRDACRSSHTSSIVRTAVESDVLWDNFLPADYKEILSRLVSSVHLKSKRDLYVMLSNPCLLDGGKKIFSIDKATNKKCYLISARELNIAWSHNPNYWCWKPLNGSRFSEVVELVTIWWLEICGRMNTKMLSPNTTYVAYLVFKISKRAYGLDTLASEVFVQVGDYRTSEMVYLTDNLSTTRKSESVCAAKRSKGEEYKIRKGKNGWMEIELGEFFCDGSEKEVKMGLREIKGGHLKGGIVIEGIQIMPKD